jgi:hypothetical protein
MKSLKSLKSLKVLAIATSSLTLLGFTAFLWTGPVEPVAESAPMAAEQSPQGASTVVSSVRPVPRPSNVIQIGNHWVFEHETLDCDREPVCSIDVSPNAERGDHDILALSEDAHTQMRAAIQADLVQAIEQQ